MSPEMQSPLVSVVIPSYNAEPWIRQTIRSALAQTYPNIEVIVVDDGSTDSTADIVRRLMTEDSRLSLSVQKNRGVGAARNHGIALAKGEFIAPLDHDDLWSPDKIEKQLNCMLEAQARGEPVGMVYCWSEIIDEEGRIIHKGMPRRALQGDVFDRLLVENFMGNGSTPLVRTSLAREIGGYREGGSGGCADWIFYLMVARRCRVAAVEEYLVGYRQFEASMSHNTQKMLAAHHEMVQVLTARFADLPASRIRDSRTAMLCWMLYRARPFSLPFFRILGQVLKNDCFFWARIFTSRQLLRMFHVRCWRMWMRLRKKGRDRSSFLPA